MENRNLTDYERGWLEGIIDGEGSLSLNKHKSKNARRGFTYLCTGGLRNTSKELILRAFQLVGGSWGGPYINKNGLGKRPIYQLWIGPKVLRVLLPQIRLLTHKERIRQLLIEALELTKVHTNLSTPYDSRLDELCAEVRSLQSKGGGRHIR